MKADKLLVMLTGVREEYILEAMERPVRRRLPAGKLLLAAALLLIGVSAAVASLQSQLLNHIFRNSAEPPTPAAEAHLVQLDGNTAADVSFRVDEYLLDDETLYLTWTAENHTGEPLIFFGPFIEGRGEYSFYAGMLRTAVGGEVMGAALPEAYSETSEFHVTGGGEGPVKVTMLAQAPVAEFVDSRTSSPVGKPVIVWNAALRQVESLCFGYEVHPAKILWNGQLVDDDGSDGWDASSTAIYNYDDRDEPPGDDFVLLEGMLRQAEEDERLGYAKLAKRWDVDVTLEKGARRRSLAAALPRFERDGFTLVVTEFTQTDLTNRLRFQVVPKTEGMFKDGPPHFDLFVNGAAEAARSITGQGAFLNDGWTFSSATPVDDTLRIAAWELEWLNDGAPIREIRLAPVEIEGEAIVWKIG